MSRDEMQAFEIPAEIYGVPVHVVSEDDEWQPPPSDSIKGLGGLVARMDKERDNAAGARE